MRPAEGWSHFPRSERTLLVRTPRGVAYRCSSCARVEIAFERTLLTLNAEDLAALEHVMADIHPSLDPSAWWLLKIGNNLALKLDANDMREFSELVHAAAGPGR